MAGKFDQFDQDRIPAPQNSRTFQSDLIIRIDADVDSQPYVWRFLGHNDDLI